MLKHLLISRLKTISAQEIPRQSVLRFHFFGLNHSKFIKSNKIILNIN